MFRGVFIRAFTPVDAGRTLIIWRAARNYAHDDESVTERLREVYEGTMIEDQPLLEAIQATRRRVLGIPGQRRRRRRGDPRLPDRGGAARRGARPVRDPLITRPLCSGEP